jgi:hypothetical protein
MNIYKKLGLQDMSFRLIPHVRFGSKAGSLMDRDKKKFLIFSLLNGQFNIFI